MKERRWNMGAVRFMVLTILNFIFGVIGLLLGLRIVLRLFAANASTPAVSWLYNVTDGLIQPFSGIFPNIALGGAAVLDVVALISLVVYSIVFYIVAGLIRATVHGIQDEERIAHDHV